VAVVGGVSFAQVSAGYYQTCGVTSAGVAYCWGLNRAGQLGDGSLINRSVPTLVNGGVSFAAYRALVDLFPTQTAAFTAVMASLGYDPANSSTDITTPAGVGNVAAADRTQWYDDGPPKTLSKPLTNGTRFYRVILAPAVP
jgi:hypothetical protein